jgi:hypothetical protein
MAYVLCTTESTEATSRLLGPLWLHWLLARKSPSPQRRAFSVFSTTPSTTPTFRKLCFLMVPQHHVAINPTYLLKECCALGRSSTELRHGTPPESQRARRSLRAHPGVPARHKQPHRMPSHSLRSSKEVHTRNYRTQTNLVPTWTHPNKKSTSLSRREAVIHCSLVNHISLNHTISL